MVTYFKNYALIINKCIPYLAFHLYHVCNYSAFTLTSPDISFGRRTSQSAVRVRKPSN